jgi:hypothetical protein
VNLFARHWSVVVLACAVLFAACKDQPAPPSPAVAGTGQPVSPSPKTDPVRPAHIILVSFDGTRPDTAQTAAMPTFQAMAREGAVSWSARSIVPPLTLPAHTSMLTGLGP